MKTKMLFGTVVLLAGSLLAADSGPQAEVKNAAKKLAEKGSYSWKTTSESANSQRRMGPVEGKIENGLIQLNMVRGENTVEAVVKGAKVAVKTDEGWKTGEEVGQDESNQRNRFLGRMLQAYKAPATEAEDLAGLVKDLKKTEEGYAGDLTEQGVIELMTRGFRRPGTDAPSPTNPKGSVKFWVKDGILAKYEVKVQAGMNFNGNDVNIDRTTTTEIKEVGATKVNVPEEAKKKVS